MQRNATSPRGADPRPPAGADTPVDAIDRLLAQTETRLRTVAAGRVREACWAAPKGGPIVVVEPE